jgi:hypothetical protein
MNVMSIAGRPRKSADTNDAAAAPESIDSAGGAPEARAEAMNALLEERARFGAEYEHLVKIDAQRLEAVRAVEALEREAAEIDRSEREAWSTFMRSPETEPPAPLAAQRQALAQKRILASGDLANSLNAGKAIAPRLAQISDDLRRIGRQIYRHRLADVVAQIPRIAQEFLDAHQRQGEAMIKLKGMQLAFCEEMAATQNGGDDATASALQTAMSRLEAPQTPSSSPNFGDILAAAAGYREQLR